MFPAHEFKDRYVWQHCYGCVRVARQLKLLMCTVERQPSWEGLLCDSDEYIRSLRTVEEAFAPTRYWSYVEGIRLAGVRRIYDEHL